MPLRIYLDTEFNGFRGALISLALVAENGREWYECMESADRYEPWVAEHVIPILGKQPVSRQEFRASFVKFIEWFDRPEIIADWHTDILHFCELLEGDSFPESVWFDGKFRVVQTPEGQPKSKIPHNALEDARALMRWHQCNSS
jgi:hypothetical protein